jgi:hypothetical protein
VDEDRVGGGVEDLAVITFAFPQNGFRTPQLIQKPLR